MKISLPEALARLFSNPEDEAAKKVVDESSASSLAREKAEAERLEAERLEAERLAKKRATDKYELVPIESESDPHFGFFRVRALRDFADVKAGTIGGYIKSEENLSQTGNCWLYSGRIAGNAQVSGNAKIVHSDIFGNAKISGNALLHESFVTGNAQVSGNALLYNCTVKGEARVSGDVKIGRPNYYSSGSVEITEGNLEGDFSFAGSGKFMCPVPRAWGVDINSPLFKL